MIQRIQTIYLALSLFFALLLYFQPIASIVSPQTFEQLMIYGLQSNPKIWLYILYAPMIVLPLMQIFQYKNLKKQLFNGKLLLGSWIVWLIVFALLLKFYLLNGLPEISIQWHFAAIFPVVSIVLVLLANRAIRKDYALLSSINRIR